MTTTTECSSTALDGRDFEFLQTFLLERSAIVLADDKHYLVASRLGPVARQLGIETVAGVVHQLRRSRDENVETKVIEAMTTNETLWFRDVKPFNALRHHVIPEIIERNGTAKRLSLWSAASSTGQELYSVAMMLASEFPSIGSWPISLIGTDINSSVIERARNGRFTSLEINRGLPAEMVARYFIRDGAQYAIAESIRSMVSFSTMNLASDWPLLPKFDIILLRNVLIYFDNEMKKRIIEKAVEQLTPHGYLFLGSAETVFGIATELLPRTIEGTTIYQKGVA